VRETGKDEKREEKVVAGRICWSDSKIAGSSRGVVSDLAHV